MDSKEIIKKVEENISKPMVTAKFGDNWREHAMKMYDIDNIFDIAWRQGRKSILLERELDKICNLQNVTNRALKLQVDQLEAQNKLLNFMVENGLGAEDMINYITYPCEL